MTPDEAAWVRANVWTPAFRAVEAAYTHGYLTRCPCQGGICGACTGTMDKGRPRHDRCLSRQLGGPIVYPLTHVTDGQFMVCGPPLWPATGPSCRYICPCPCVKTGLFYPPAPTHRAPTAKRARARTPATTSTVSGQLGLDLEAML